MNPRLKFETWGTRLCIALYVLACVFAVYHGNHYSFARYRWDFIAPYSGAKCLLHGCDPYSPAELNQQYLAAHGDPAAFDPRHTWHVLTPVYPPTTFLLVAPFAAAEYPAAQMAWYLAGSVLFCVAFALLSQIAVQRQRWLFWLLASVATYSSNTDLLFRPGNPSVFAIALAAIAVWAFFTEQESWVATAALSLALMMKPHLAVAVWFCLLLRSEFRRRAIASGAIAVSVLLACLVRLQATVGTAWIANYRQAVAEGFLPGGSGSPLNAEAFRFLNLQTVFGLWSPRPATYDGATYAVVAAIFAVWLAAWLRSDRSRQAVLLAIAGLACLSLLPVYHRDYDSRLLIVTLPPMLALLANRPRAAWVIAAASFPVLFCQTTLHMERWMERWVDPASLGKWGTVVALRQQTLALLALAILWPLVQLTQRKTPAIAATGLAD